MWSSALFREAFSSLEFPYWENVAKVEVPLGAIESVNFIAHIMIKAMKKCLWKSYLHINKLVVNSLLFY